MFQFINVEFLTARRNMFAVSFFPPILLVADSTYDSDYQKSSCVEALFKPVVVTRPGRELGRDIFDNFLIRRHFPALLYTLTDVESPTLYYYIVEFTRI